MGHQVDLVQLGLPEYVDCPFCKGIVPTYYDSFDIEGGSGLKNGILKEEGFECPECLGHFDITCIIKVTVEIVPR